jgi:hypothetical protein
VLFALIHIFGGRLRFLDRLPRSAWLSAAGGTSVAYVFVHLLPEAEHFAKALDQDWVPAWLHEPVYLLALLGLGTFYGLERFALKCGRGRSSDGSDDKKAAPTGIFWIHIGSFAFYNVLISYLLVREADYQIGEMWLFAVAMSLHFLVNDKGLREHHQHVYRHRGRWILAAATLVGWGIGVFVSVPDAAVAMLFGFLCGATVLNVLKEELPAERESRFWAFALGAVGFTALLLMIPGQEPVHDAGHKASNVVESGHG